jgi:phosphodiesterase/alkaline phosphatase D-like protein
MLPPAAAALAVLLALTAVASAASAPTAKTGSHGNITDHSAVLRGVVNPNGSATTYYFQYGLTTAYGVNTVQHSAGSGTARKSVRALAGSLLPGTIYHYRLVATNAAGTAVGADHTVKTAGNPPPLVATGPATQVSKNAATLTAVVNPNKQDTTYYFQYGTTTAYGLQTVSAVVPAGTVPVTVSAVLQGLEARTIFHYRVVALHGNSGAQPGADGTFMTLPRHRQRPRIRARTTPFHDPHRPFAFTTSGSVKGPSWIPGIYDCRGDVTVRFFRGRQRVGSTLIPLQPNCRFSGQTVFRRGKPGTLTVFVRFAGNGYLTPRRAPAETIKRG